MFDIKTTLSIPASVVLLSFLLFSFSRVGQAMYHGPLPIPGPSPSWSRALICNLLAGTVVTMLLLWLGHWNG